MYVILYIILVNNDKNLNRNQISFFSILLLTLKVGRHPSGRIRAAWKVQKLIKAYDAR